MTNQKIKTTILLFISIVIISSPAHTIPTGTGGHEFPLGSDSGDNFAVNTDDFVIKGDTGEVGIGTSNPSRFLEINGSVVGFMSEIDNTSSNSAAQGMLIRLSNVTLPGNSNDFMVFRSSLATVGQIDGDSVGGSRFITSSDKRLKTNIKPLSGAMDTLQKIRSVTYEHSSAPEKKMIGFIAQELQEVFPTAVSGNPTDDPLENPMGVDYGKLTPLLVRAIQEQQVQIEKLEEQIKALKADTKNNL